MNPNARQSHFADVKSNKEIEPCLSVLVPVYNEESTVVPVLRHVEQMSFAKIEGQIGISLFDRTTRTLTITPQGERLRAIATKGDLSHRTARAIAWLRANYTKPLHMEELAAAARMGVSTLHHQFRALTAMSPLQYQKQIRLQKKS